MLAHGKESNARQRHLCRATCLATRQRVGHGDVWSLCRAAFLCRAACRIFAVIISLPCVLVGLCHAHVRCCAPLLSLPACYRALLSDFAVRFVFAVCATATHGKDAFTVRRHTAMIACTAMPFFPVLIPPLESN
jgi:hypothetical protein